MLYLIQQRNQEQWQAVNQHLALKQPLLRLPGDYHLVWPGRGQNTSVAPLGTLQPPGRTSSTWAIFESTGTGGHKRNDS